MVLGCFVFCCALSHPGNWHRICEALLIVDDVFRSLWPRKVVPGIALRTKKDDDVSLCPGKQYPCALILDVLDVVFGKHRNKKQRFTAKKTYIKLIFDENRRAVNVLNYLRNENTHGDGLFRRSLLL